VTRRDRSTRRSRPCRRGVPPCPCGIRSAPRAWGPARRPERRPAGRAPGFSGFSRFSEGCRFEAGDSGAEVGQRIVPELDHERVPIEGGLDDAALHAAAAPVDEAHLGDALGCGRAHVFVDDRADVGGRERVQVDFRPDRNAARCVSQFLRSPASQFRSFTYAAVTIVPIPPRTEKSPTTVIRRGSSRPTRSSRISLVAAS
jgi:hypothetical protein